VIRFANYARNRFATTNAPSADFSISLINKKSQSLPTAIGFFKRMMMKMNILFLAKYWGNILGKTAIYAYQVSERGGYMNLKINDTF
jgi:hypothetical protein